MTTYLILTFLIGFLVFIVLPSKLLPFTGEDADIKPFYERARTVASVCAFVTFLAFETQCVLDAGSLKTVLIVLTVIGGLLTAVSVLAVASFNNGHIRRVRMDTKRPSVRDLKRILDIKDSVHLVRMTVTDGYAHYSLENEAEKEKALEKLCKYELLEDMCGKVITESELMDAIAVSTRENNYTEQEKKCLMRFVGSLREELGISEAGKDGKE